MRQVFAAVVVMLTTSIPAAIPAAAKAEQVAHKTSISTTIRLYGFDNGKYTAEVRTQALPCPGVSVDNLKSLKGVVDADDVFDKLREYFSALYASIDHQAERCHKN
jgi:hypothetical protein